MFAEFNPLPEVPLSAGTSILQPLHALPERITLDSPALHVMTDLRRTSAVLVRSGDTVAHATCWASARCSPPEARARRCRNCWCATS